MKAKPFFHSSSSLYIQKMFHNTTMTRSDSMKDALSKDAAALSYDSLSIAQCNITSETPESADDDRSIPRQWLAQPTECIAVPDPTPQNREEVLIPQQLLTAALIAFTALAGVCNNVTGKIRSKPLGSYDFFTLQVNAVFYLLSYFVLFMSRLLGGYITKEQIDFVMSPYMPQPSSRRRGESLGVVMGELHQPLAAVTSYRNPLSPALLCASLSMPLVDARGDLPQRHARRSEEESDTSEVSGFSCWGPWKYFVMNSLLQALGQAVHFILQPYVPQAAILLTYQMSVPLSVVVAMVINSTRYLAVQILGVMLIVVGGVIGGYSELREFPCTFNTLLFPLLLFGSLLPTVIAFTLSEKIFKLYAYHAEKSGFEDDSLDVFFVGFVINALNLIVSPLFTPLNFILGISESSLWVYAKEGFQCFTGITPQSVDQSECAAWGCCRYALPAYAVYFPMNMAFNIGMACIIKYASAVHTFFATKLILPLTLIAFVLPSWISDWFHLRHRLKWPLLAAHDMGVSVLVFVSCFFIVSGLYVYERGVQQRKRLQREGFWNVLRSGSPGSCHAEPPCLWPLLGRTSLPPSEAY